MSMTLKSRKVDQIVVLDMSGRLSAGEATLLLRETLRAFKQDGSKFFLLNLAEVSYVDSSGLGELIATYTGIRRDGGDVKLLKLGARIKDLLQLTKLLTVFDTFEDEAQAIKSFPASRAASNG